MTRTLQRGRLGQATALAVTCLLLGLLWLGAARPLDAWYAERARQIVQREGLARDLAKQAASVPALAARAKALGRGAIAEDALLAGATDAIAGAELQENLQRLAVTHGANPSSVETLAARSAGQYRRIGIGVTLAVTWPVLIRLLGAVDLATPRMRVGEIEVRASPFRPQKAEQPLDVMLTIFGFRGEESAARTVQQSPGRAARHGLRNRVAEWQRTALGRPLFDPSRLPVASGGASGGNALPRLAGIVVSPAGREAIFTMQAGGKPILAGVGGSVAGWSVTEISPIEVTIERARQVQVLRPAFVDGSDGSRMGEGREDAGGPSAYPPDAQIPAITRLLEHSPE